MVKTKAMLSDGKTLENKSNNRYNYTSIPLPVSGIRHLTSGNILTYYDDIVKFNSVCGYKTV